MRILLLHNRIHRAFPELDRYTDERCRKFLGSAQRGWIGRVLRAAVIFLAFAVVLVGGLFGVGFVIEGWLDGFGSRYSLVREFFLFLVPICAAPLAAALTRDYLLRRRVRWVLRTRGVCSACRYSLIGLPVSAAHTVTCPECSLESEVDPSLGELVVDEAGMGRFRPSAAALPPPPRIFTPRRVRTLKRVAIITALVVCVGFPALLGGYELWLRHQASVALAEKPGAQPLTALARSIQPPGTEGQPNAWDALEDAIARLGQATILDEANNPPPENGWTYADFTRIYMPAPADQDESTARQNAANEAVARRRLDLFRQAGVYDAFDRMARSPYAVRTFLDTPGQPSAAWLYTETTDMRRAAMCNAARSWIAQQSGDLTEYISAIEANLAMARVSALQPTLAHGSVAVSIELMTYGRLRRLLESHPAPEWLDAVDSAIARQRFAMPPDARWEGERIATLDNIAWVFSDPSRVRWGRFGETVRDFLDHGDLEYEGNLGTYAANREAANAFYRDAKALAELPRWQRSAPPARDADPPLVRALVADPRSALRFLEQPELVRAGYVVSAALERFHAANGRYPTSLAELVPLQLSALPIDPWSGKSFGYHLRSADAPAADPRGYILYSLGADGQDDGGHRDPTSWGSNFAALRESASGTDYILNDWTPQD